jgi:hypothetical protein
MVGRSSAGGRSQLHSVQCVTLRWGARRGLPLPLRGWVGLCVRCACKPTKRPPPIPPLLPAA